MMIKQSAPTAIFWNFTGFAIAILSCGVSWSLFNASNYKLEALNNKLEVNSAVEKVKEVSDTLEKSAGRLPVVEKIKIQKQLDEVNEELSSTQQKILTDSNSNSYETAP